MNYPPFYLLQLLLYYPVMSCDELLQKGLKTENASLEYRIFSVVNNKAVYIIQKTCGLTYFNVALNLGPKSPCVDFQNGMEGTDPKQCERLVVDVLLGNDWNAPQVCRRSKRRNTEMGRMEHSNLRCCWHFGCVSKDHQPRISKKHLN